MKTYSEALRMCDTRYTTVRQVEDLYNRYHSLVQEIASDPDTHSVAGGLLELSAKIDPDPYLLVITAIALGVQLGIEMEKQE